MSIIQLFYSDETEKVYLDEKSAQVDEKAKINAKLVSEFDNIRKDYNQEYAKLKAKYQPKFEAVLEAIKRNSDNN